MSKYAWEGEVIKINQRDFDLWQQSNPMIDLPAYLAARDAWLRQQPEDERKGWFCSTATALFNHTQKLRAEAKRDDGVAMWFGGIKIREDS